MTYEEVLQYLYNSLPMYQRVGNVAIKKDLTNTITLCNSLHNPQLKFKSVHVGGTNGKGSSTHSIASILQCAGYKTGLYTSPHLKDFTERIRINGEPISKEAVINFVVQNKNLLEQVQPSFFEMTVIMAFDHFAREEVDVAVIEVGLGGRLDSTNVITPMVSLITNIGYDHTDMLGDTLAQIAFEKGGIIKEGIPVVIGEKHEETIPVFTGLAEERKAPLFFAQDFYVVEVADKKGGKWIVNVDREGKHVFENLELALMGSYQLKNLPGILKTVDVLREQGLMIEKGHVISGLARVTALTGLKGRWQILSNQPLTICDTGHNQEAFRDIVAQLESLPHTQLHWVLGFSADKDVSKVLRLLPQYAQYYFCQAQVPRAMNAHLLQEKGAQMGLMGEAFFTVEEAVEAARQKAGSSDIIFIGGSTFVVAEINEL